MNEMFFPGQYKKTLSTLGELSKFGIPKRSIEAMQKKEKISLNEKVELIQFEVV